MVQHFYATLAFIAAGQALFLAVILFMKHENRLPNRFIAGLLLLLGITLTEWGLWWSGGIRHLPVFKALSFGFPLLYGPLMWLFYEMVFNGKNLTTRHLWHFLPFGATVVLMLPFYLRFFENISESLAFIPPLTRKGWFPVLIFAQMIGYGIWIWQRFSPHFEKNKELKKWHWWLLASYTGIIGTYLLYRLLPSLGLTAQEWKYLIAGSLSVFIYMAAWIAFVKPRVFAGMPFAAALTGVKYKNSTLSPERSVGLYQQILTLFEQEKLYASSELSLDFLANKLGENRHHVSQAINEQSGKSFWEMVNERRIETAKELLTKTTKQELNVVEIAYQVGFNSKNAFNIAFKKYVGMTPSDFRKTCSEKAQSYRI
jgi:AraC-like DNA-binding protein